MTSYNEAKMSILPVISKDNYFNSKKFSTKSGKMKISMYITFNRIVKLNELFSSLYSLGQNAWPPKFRHSFDCRPKTSALRDAIFCMYFLMIVRKLVSKGISDQSYFEVTRVFFPSHVF